MTEQSRWISLWTVSTPNGYPPIKEGYKIEYMYSDYDGSAIKYRYVKDDCSASKE